MSQNENAELSDLDEFNAADFMSSHAQKQGEEAPDGCGVADRKTKCIIITPDGADPELFTYSHFEGATIKPWGLVLIFRITKEYPDPDGELKTYQTFWRVTVKGKRLDTVIKQIAELIRYTLFKSESEGEDRPYVSSIELTPFEPDHFEQPQP